MSKKHQNRYGCKIQLPLSRWHVRADGILISVRNYVCVCVGGSYSTLFLFLTVIQNYYEFLCQSDLFFLSLFGSITHLLSFCLFVIFIFNNSDPSDMFTLFFKHFKTLILFALVLLVQYLKQSGFIVACSVRCIKTAFPVIFMSNHLISFDYLPVVGLSLLQPFSSSLPTQPVHWDIIFQFYCFPVSRFLTQMFELLHIQYHPF